MKDVPEFYIKHKILNTSNFTRNHIVIYESLALIFKSKDDLYWVFLGRQSFSEVFNQLDFKRIDEIIIIGGGDFTSLPESMKNDFRKLKKECEDHNIYVQTEYFCNSKIHKISFSPSVEIKTIEVEKEIIVVVDDSPTFLKLLSRKVSDILGEEYLVFPCANPYMAFEISFSIKSALLITDINMPFIDGLKLTQLTAKNHPILLISGEVESQDSSIVEALQWGAIDFVDKEQIKEEIFKEKIQSLIKSHLIQFSEQDKLEDKDKNYKHKKSKKNTDLVIIGTSTGGVQTLEYLFSKVQAISQPVMIIIHMPKNYTRHFTFRLSEKFKHLKFKFIEKKQRIYENAFYILSGNSHHSLEFKDGHFVNHVHSETKVKGFCPNIDFTLNSVSELKTNKKIEAGILTGMGKDGAQGLQNLSSNGSFTFTQDAKSSIIYGMPKAAKELSPDSETLTLKEIADYLDAG